MMLEYQSTLKQQVNLFKNILLLVNWFGLQAEMVDYGLQHQYQDTNESVKHWLNCRIARPK